MSNQSELTRFFETYAAFSQSDDPKQLAALYAPTFIVAGPQGSHAFANDERFLDWLRQVRAANLEHGMRALAPAAVDSRALSPAHVLATVTWSARFAKTGERPIDFRIAYLLETAPAMTILAYISEDDEEAEKKRLGIEP
jgi:hypothetical protein